MKTPKLAVAVGYIDDDLVSGAIDYIPVQRKNIIHYWKYVVVAAACISVILGINSYLKQYVISNNIQVQYDNSDSGSALSHDDVNPEMAGKSAKANNMHNLLVTKKLEWYSHCYYDYDLDVVKIGLTENTETNQKEFFKIIDDTFKINGDTDIQFYECRFSYQHLEEVYNNLDSGKLLLKIVGVKRYNISVIDNCINVYLNSEKNNFAIFVTNIVTDEDEAIQFKVLSGTTFSSDGRYNGRLK
ncbi:MAG: hypothetical protein IJZ16_05210 [Clostridia bacterium]|nr:hypothetical protein [Clostridia bacterium]